MNQHGLYYTFIICCLIYVILIGQCFHAAKSRFQEPRIIITQLPSFSLSKQNTDITISYSSTMNMHVNNAFSISTLSITNTEPRKRAKEKNRKNLEQVTYLLDTTIKISDQRSLQRNAQINRIQESIFLQKAQKISTHNSVKNTHYKNDKQMHYIRLILFVLHTICSKVNAPSLIERVEARLNLATKAFSGLLGTWIDVIIARALPRYFAQSGSFYAYNYDPYILNDVITLLQYPSVVTREQQKGLWQFRTIIAQHPFNRRLHAMISALRQNNITMVKRIMQPHNRIISMLYQEYAAKLGPT